MGEGPLGQPVDLRRVKTFPLKQRRSFVQLRDLARISDPPPGWEHPELEEVVDRILASHKSGSNILWSMGAHVIKAGLGPYVSDLVKRKVISHVAGNGAVAIHDFELALIGATSEDVASGIENGTFGMWEETGRYMNEAAQYGAEKGIGLGRSLGEFMAGRTELFPHRDVSVIWNCFQQGIPLTVHVTIGADITHQHPKVDFAALGSTSGRDFEIYCRTVSLLEGGVLLNFGSAVTAPEVFLKALSVARNIGSELKEFTTANFDIVPLGDYRNVSVTDEIRPEYYYRPWKNIVVRPPGAGGKGFHIEGAHRSTIPNLYHRLVEKLETERG